MKILKEEGITSLFGFDYKEKFGQVSLIEIAKRFNKFIKSLKIQKTSKIYIVGISQGGIIASYWLEFLNGKKICKNLITICTPFHGTYGGYIIKNKGAKELVYNSDFLEELKKKASKSKVNYYGIWNPLDLMVFPGNKAQAKFQKQSKRIFSICHPSTFKAKETKEFIKEVIIKS